MDTILLVLSYLVHHYIWISTDALDSELAIGYLTKLDLGFVSSLDTNTRTFNVAYLASQNLWLSIDTLQINTSQLTIEYIGILNANTIISFRDYMECSLSEVGESTVWYLDVWVDGYSSSTLICFITDEVAADQVDWCLRERSDTAELLIELIW